jgi:hypothetical protein
MPSPLAAPAKKSVSDKIYDSLIRRLQPISQKLPIEVQTEIDGIAAEFASDVAEAFRVVAHFGKLK